MPIDLNAAVDPLRERSDSTHSPWIEAIRACVERFGTFDSCAWILYRFLASPNARLESAREIIARDPFLASEVARECELSMDGPQVRATLSRVALRRWFQDIIPFRLRAYGLFGRDFERRSLACAAAMDFLGDDEAKHGASGYAIGLLHALGQILIDQAVERIQDEPIRLTSSPLRKLASVERAFFGLNHAEVAGMALRAWKFPGWLVAPIEEQFLAHVSSPLFETVQRLSIARFVAHKIAGSDRVARPGRWGEIVYLGKTLSDVYDYAARASQLAAAPRVNA